MLEWTWECRYPFDSLFAFYQISPQKRALGHMVVIFLISSGASILFSVVAEPICIPTNSSRGFLFLIILTNTCYLLSFWWWPFWQVWGDISLWFWFAFPWWLVMLSTFSCICWLFVYLWKNVSVPRPIFNQTVWGFLLLGYTN